MMLNNGKTWVAPKGRYSKHDISMLWNLLRPTEKPLNERITEELEIYNSIMQKHLIETCEVMATTKYFTSSIKIECSEGYAEDNTYYLIG